MSALAVMCVQSLQDDEDDRMEDGVRLVTSILGPDKVSLYPHILQLVMADGAYTEGQLAIVHIDKLFGILSESFITLRP